MGHPARRPAGDPTLAAAAVERLDASQRAFTDMAGWTLLLTTVAARVAGSLAVLVAALMVVLWFQGEPGTLWIAGALLAAAAALVVGLPWAQRRLLDWTQHRLTRTIAANRAVAADPTPAATSDLDPDR